MSETCRCGDEAWWEADGKDSDTLILCETCGGWEELDKDGYCDCKECRMKRPNKPIEIVVNKVTE